MNCEIIKNGNLWNDSDDKNEAVAGQVEKICKDDKGNIESQEFSLFSSDKPVTDRENVKKSLLNFESNGFFSNVSKLLKNTFLTKLSSDAEINTVENKQQSSLLLLTEKHENHEIKKDETLNNPESVIEPQKAGKAKKILKKKRKSSKHVKKNAKKRKSSMRKNVSRKRKPSIKNLQIFRKRQSSLSHSL